MKTNSQHKPRERGAVLVELALAIPIFLVLIAAIFDLGMAFNASRTSAETSRSAARAAAAAGGERLADFRALETVRSQYNDDLESVTWVTIYRADSVTNSEVPDQCKPTNPSVTGLCNTYSATQLAGLSVTDFDSPTCSGDPDAAWCPTTRVQTGSAAPFVGVAIWVEHEPVLGLLLPNTELADSAVFRVETPDDFEPPVIQPTPTPKPPFGSTPTPTPDFGTECGITIFADQNYEGTALWVSALNAGTLPTGWQNVVSSYQVSGGCTVVASDGVDGLGGTWCIELPPSSADNFANDDSLIWIGLDTTCPDPPDPVDCSTSLSTPTGDVVLRNLATNYYAAADLATSNVTGIADGTNPAAHWTTLDYGNGYVLEASDGKVWDGAPGPGNTTLDASPDTDDDPQTITSIGPGVTLYGAFHSSYATDAVYNTEWSAVATPWSIWEIFPAECGAAYAPDCGIILAQHFEGTANYPGAMLYVSELNDGDLPAGYQNVASAYVVQPGCSVAVSNGFGGSGSWCEVLPAGSHGDFTSNNDQLVWVGANASCAGPSCTSTTLPLPSTVVIQNNSTNQYASAYTTNVQPSNDGTTSAAQWNVIANGTDYVFQSVSTGLYIDGDGVGLNTDLSTTISADDIWTVTPDGAGIATIYNTANPSYLNDAGTNINAVSSGGGATAKWLVIDASCGTTV